MKKVMSVILSLAILVTASISLSLSATATAVTVPDFVIGDNWTANDTENYWGPYGDYSLTDGTLVFDQASNSWCTLNLKWDNYDHNYTYQYMDLVMKADSTTGNTVQLSIGQTADGKQNGKPLSDWKLADGTTGITLTTEYQTFRVDLTASGTTQFFVGNGIPDFALNKTDGTAKISIDSIKLIGGTYDAPDTTTTTDTTTTAASEITTATDTTATTVTNQPVDYVVGDKWAANDSENYWGPYGGFKLNPADGTLTWNSDDSWGTLGFRYETYDHTNEYKYLVLVAKTDSPDSSPVQVSIGQDANDSQHGMPLKDWTLADGTTGAALGTEYQSFVIDLNASGVAKFFVQGKPDFAFNAIDGTACTITIDKIYLTNEIPTVSTTTTAGATTLSTAATTSTSAAATTATAVITTANNTTVSTESSNPATGDTNTTAVSFAVLLLAAAAGTALLRVKKSKSI